MCANNRHMGITAIVTRCVRGAEWNVNRLQNIDTPMHVIHSVICAGIGAGIKNTNTTMAVMIRAMYATVSVGLANIATTTIATPPATSVVLCGSLPMNINMIAIAAKVVAFAGMCGMGMSTYIPIPMIQTAMFAVGSGMFLQGM